MKSIYKMLVYCYESILLIGILLLNNEQTLLAVECCEIVLDTYNLQKKIWVCIQTMIFQII